MFGDLIKLIVLILGIYFGLDLLIKIGEISNER
ncbi:Uncharacterised protein [uncultured Clostridium sp.]|nr:Uncharacterised protein [uncultured Clostridium sp.]SCJ49798.1 Uncharacterised protein [uncultured Clostridium sp.]